MKREEKGWGGGGGGPSLVAVAHAVAPGTALQLLIL